MTQQDACTLLDTVAEAMGEPFADSSALPTFVVSKLALQYLIDHAPVPDIPSDLTEGIERTQATIDLLATELDQEPFDAADLFDERFGPVAGEAAAAARDGGSQ